MDAEAREALRRAIAHEHLLFTQAQQASAEADRWRERSALALRRGEDELARQALDRAALIQQRADMYRAEYERQGAALRGLKERPLPLASLDRLDELALEDRLERDLAELKRQLAQR